MSFNKRLAGESEARRNLAWRHAESSLQGMIGLRQKLQHNKDSEANCVDLSRRCYEYRYWVAAW